MAKTPPNSFQKFVRGVLRDLVNSGNPPKSQPEKPINSPKLKRKKNGGRSRYIPSSVRVSVLQRDGCKCVFCGRTASQIQLEVDHIIPFSQGGSNDFDNLQTLCIDCNRGKGARQFSS